MAISATSIRALMTAFQKPRGPVVERVTVSGINAYGEPIREDIDLYEGGGTPSALLYKEIITATFHGVRRQPGG